MAVPTNAEWTVLTDYLGGEAVAGGKMKEIGTTNWFGQNTDATNESGFTGLPGGGRNYNGYYLHICHYGNWWSSTENSTSGAWGRYLYYNYGDAYRGYGSKGLGLSVRCLRD